MSDFFNSTTLRYYKRIDALFEYLVKCLVNGQFCPTNQELANYFDLSSISGPVKLLKHLEEQGRVEVLRPNRNSRAIKLKGHPGLLKSKYYKE